MQRYKQKHPNTIIEAMQQLHMDATYTVANEENTQESRHANVVSVTVPVGHWLVKTTENGVDYQTITWNVLSNEKFHSLYEPEAVKRKDEKIYPTSEDLKRLEDIAKRQQLEEYLKQKERNVPSPWTVPSRDGQYWCYWDYRC